MWVATSSSVDPVFGVQGKFWCINPANDVDPVAVAESIALPYRCNMTSLRSSFASWTRGGQSRKYITGSATENLVFTEHKTLARLGIQAPSGPLVNTAVPVENQIGYQAIAGGGLTGNIIPYIRFYDSLNNRRSPLSGPGTAVALVNQGLSFSNVPDGPDSPDVGVTHVEVWASQDGGLPRFWFRRDIGASAFSGNSTSLGEAEIETLALLPRCRFSVMYHDRHVLAGDDRHPDRVYFSVSEDPENYAGLWISTRQGEPVIGLFVVRDVLIVQCPTIHYMVQGYDENDIRMDVLEPYIGGLGHHTMTPWNDMVVIPGNLDWYLCDGTAMKPLGAGMFDETWRDSIDQYDYKTNSWATTDVRSGIVKLNIRSQGVAIYGFPDTIEHPYRAWVLDLRGKTPELLFDTTAYDLSAGGQLALPGYYFTKSYAATSGGVIYLENVIGAADGFTGIAPIPIKHQISTAHVVVAEPIDDSDCVRFPKAWAIISNEYKPVTIEVRAGNEYQWRARDANDSLVLAAQLKQRTDDLAYYVANDRKCLPTNRCSGSAISMTILCTNDGGIVPVNNNTYPYYGAFVFKGWGADYSADGSQARGIEYTGND